MQKCIAFFTHRFLVSFWLQITVHVEPANKAIKPASAGGVFRVHAKAVTALFVEMKFDRFFCFVPAFNQAKCAIGEKRVVGGQRNHGNRDERGRRGSRGALEAHEQCPGEQLFVDQIGTRFAPTTSSASRRRTHSPGG